jgi:hypothetical protein
MHRGTKDVPPGRFDIVPRNPKRTCSLYQTGPQVSMGKNGRKTIAFNANSIRLEHRSPFQNGGTQIFTKDSGMNS